MEASRISPPPELTAPSKIGERLREARKRNGLTVREIARQISVSPSLISQIERDKVNPSVSTLWALVTVLGLTMGELFSEAEEAPEPLTPALSHAASGLMTVPGKRAVINLETGVHWERLTAETDPLVEFLTVEYPPGAASCDEDSLVRHGGKEYGYVTEGRLGVRVGFDTYELAPGMAISFDASMPHRLWAVGSQPARALWIVVGRQSDARGSIF